MKLLLIFILALLTAAFVGSLGSADTGQVLITVGDLSIQTSPLFFLITLIVLFTLFYGGIRLLVYVWELPGQLERRRARKRQQLFEKYLTRGLLALVEGRWKEAEDDLIKGARYTRTPLINYLCAARAAQRLGKISNRDDYLSLAHSADPDNKIALGLTQAELQLAQQQIELALATLTHLHEEQPQQKQVKLLLLKTCTELKAWRDVLKLLPELGRARVLPEGNITAIQIQAYAGLLQDAGSRASRNELDNVWKSIPKKLRHELHVLEVYTTEKLKFADTTDCEPLLRQALKHHWDAASVRLYGLVAGEDPVRQLAFAESLQSAHAKDADLLLTLGRLCIRNALWGKAASYLKECIHIEARPEAYRELAMLLERQGDYAGASSYYQQGLALVTDVVRHDSVKLLDQAEEEKMMAAGARQVV